MQRHGRKVYKLMALQRKGGWDTWCVSYSSHTNLCKNYSNTVPSDNLECCKIEGRHLCSLHSLPNLACFSYFLLLKLVYLKEKELALLISKIMIQNPNFDHLCKPWGTVSLNGLLRSVRLCGTEHDVPILSCSVILILPLTPLLTPINILCKFPCRE